MGELDVKELKEIEGGAIGSAAAVGAALLGVGAGVVIGALLAVCVCYVIKKCCE
jgi:hypothetical protein